MWNFIKHKITTFVVLFIIALVMLAVTGLAKLVLRGVGYGESGSNELGRRAGEYVGKGLFGFVLLVGCITVVRQIITEVRRRTAPPPPLPPSPPPLRSDPLPSQRDSKP